MRFDREAPGEGAEAICRLENGKAVLEWRFYFTEETEDGTGAGEGGTHSGIRRRPEDMAGGEQNSEGQNSRKQSDMEQKSREQSGEEQNDTERPADSEKRRELKSGEMIRLTLLDMQGNTVLEGIQPLREEEPLCCILLQPRLWNGIPDPYLYRLEAHLTDRDGSCLDHISRPLALRTVSDAGDAGKLSLNGEVLERRAVAYFPPFAATEAERRQLITEDLRRLLPLGANCVCVESMEGLGRPFLHLCDRYGFLLFSGEGRDAGYARFCGDHSGTRIPWEESVPRFRGGKDCLFPGADGLPGSLFYRYLAKWNREPFVYIVPESVQRLKSGNYSVCCYSNCDRIVLYSDGTLFEFQRGKEEFRFSEVPAKTPCIMLTAEGDGCSMSLSLSKSVCLSESRSQGYIFAD